MSISLASPSERTLIDELLEEQQQLTAVDRFSRHHERPQLPAQARYYRDLIPLIKPQPGQQYAFAVDLDKCTGCKACVSACHSLNGLEENEIWRNVGSLYGGNAKEPYLQTVTTACHHCVEPGCLLGCPVAAYEKDEVTGIVRHLDDQCIGCEYCALKCPYNVPKYSKKRGIVRKCDMCYSRLAADEAPACVQACPNEAITIRLVDKAQARAEALPGTRLLPGAFESSYTKPTTLYSTRKAIPVNAIAGDIHRLRLEHPHWPLIWMMLLSQLSAGLSCCLALSRLLPHEAAAKLAAPLAWASFATLQAGLVVSVFHLGQPLKAWRFFLGLRTSWMSREILVFSLFAGGAATTAGASLAGVQQAPGALAWLTAHTGPLGPWLARIPLDLLARSVTPFALLTALVGLAGIYCSAMIYIDTHRPFWVRSLTLPKFFGTTAALGLSATAALVCWLEKPLHLHEFFAPVLCLASLAVATAYAAWEFSSFRSQLHDEEAPAHRSARTIRTLLRHVVELRQAVMLVFWGAAGLALLTADHSRAFATSVAFVCLFASGILERYCFFTAADAPRMPGGITA